jgi:hypothetical protein
MNASSLLCGCMATRLLWNGKTCYCNNCRICNTIEVYAVLPFMQRCYSLLCCCVPVGKLMCVQCLMEYSIRCFIIALAYPANPIILAELRRGGVCAAAGAAAFVVSCNPFDTCCIVPGWCGGSVLGSPGALVCH